MKSNPEQLLYAKKRYAVRKAIAHGRVVASTPLEEHRATAYFQR